MTLKSDATQTSKKLLGFLHPLTHLSSTEETSHTRIKPPRSPSETCLSCSGISPAPKIKQRSLSDSTIYLQGNSGQSGKAGACGGKAGNLTCNDILCLASTTLEQQNPSGTWDTSRWASKGQVSCSSGLPKTGPTPMPHTSGPKIALPYIGSCQVQEEADSATAPSC